MGRFAYLGDNTVQVHGELLVTPQGQIQAQVTGADRGRLYVQVTAPQAEATRHLVAEGAGPQQQQADWIPADISAGQTLLFTLVPVTQGIEGPTLVQIYANAGMARLLSPAAGDYNGAAWYPVAAGSGAQPAPSPTATPGLWDQLTGFLNTLPGGSTLWLAGGGVALVLLLKRKGGG